MRDVTVHGFSGWYGDCKQCVHCRARRAAVRPECGSAAAMAAAALVELCGGAPDMLGDAVSISLGNVLGLVCDPVAGLVEIPCITAMRQAWRALLLRRSSRWLAFAALSPPMKRSSR